MRCVLGFDGGGTKTDCVLMDENGHVLSRSRSGPSNPVRVGVENAAAALQRAAQDVLKAAGKSARAVAAIVAGLGGASSNEVAERMHAELARAFPGCSLKLCTDLELALAAAGNGPAVVVMAGTGSFAIGRDAAGRVERAGGYGPMIADEGSAYDIGRKAVAMALRDRDRSGADSAIGAKILRNLGFASWDELRARVQLSADQVFPRIFPIVAEAAATHDESAKSLLRDAAQELATLVRTLVERLGLANTHFMLFKNGGIVGRSPILDEAIDDSLRKIAPLAEIGALPIAPAEAAARLALELLALPRTAAGRP